MKKAMIWVVSLAFVFANVQAQSLDDAKKAMEAEKYAQAKGILEALVKSKPKDGANYFYLGLVHIHNEHLDSAKAIFDQGIVADPKGNLNQVGLGIIDLYSENTAAAESKFAEITQKLKKKDYLELYHIGRAYIDAPEPNYQKAVEYLEQAQQRNTSDPLVPLALGDAYLGFGNPSKAYVGYRDASSIDPSLTRARVQMQVITRRAHAWQEAIDGLKAIAEEVPDYAPTYRELAETYRAWALVATKTEDYNERNRQGVEYYKQYMDKTDYSVESRIRYADFLVYAKDYDELQKQAAELARLEDVNPKILRYLGYSAYKKGEYQQSKEALDRMFKRMEAERIIPQDHLHMGLVNVKLAGNDDALFEKGLADLKKAVAADSTIADDLHDVGIDVFTNSKQYARAQKIFDIPASTPSARNYIYDNFYVGLAGYYAVASKPADQRGGPENEAILRRADEAFALVIEKAPNTKDAYLHRGNINKLLDDSENPKGLAIPHLEKFIELVKADGDAEVQKNKVKLIDAYSTVAVTAVRQGEYQKGRDLCEEILKLDPNNEWAKQTLQYLEQSSAASTGQ